MKGMGLPPLEWAVWRGWPAPLMPEAEASGARHAQTVHWTGCVEALSSAQASPGLLLYFAMPATHAKRLAGALARPSLREGLRMNCGEGRNSSSSHHQRGERSRQWGARRSEVKEEGGRSPTGGHERSRVPHCLFRFQRAPHKNTTTFRQHHWYSKSTRP